MKHSKNYTFLKSFLFFTILFFTKNLAHAQVTFWTENFSAMPSAWTLNVSTGANGTDPNFFTVSAAEGGGITPNLGAPNSCGVANNGNNTMHVTSVFNPMGGASYDAGGLCGILFCPLTNTRSESPIINCVNKTTITVTFNYIENGQALLDDATLWYYNGTTWAQIDNMPKTLTGCGGQGLWTSRTVALPMSANNNANVKIGFQWQNNDDGVGTDPSFAVDDISLSSITSNTITTSSITGNAFCACDAVTIPFTSTGTFAAGNIYTMQMSDATGSFVFPTTVGTLASTANSGNINCVIPCATISGTAYRFRVISSMPSVVGSNNGTNINISALLSASATVSPNDTVCPGTSVTLTGSGPFNNWPQGISDNVPFVINTTTTYTLTTSNGNGCTSFTSIKIVVLQNVTPSVTLTSNPTVPTVNANVQYTANIPANITNYTLNWYKAGNLYTTTQSPTNSISSMATSLKDSVYVILIPKDGCYDQASAQSNSIKIQFAESVQNINMPTNFEIYPNPASDKITITGLEINDKICIRDAVGRNVMQFIYKNANDNNLNIQALATGIYMANFTRNGKQWLIKIIKE